MKLLEKQAELHRLLADVIDSDTGEITDEKALEDAEKAVSFQAERYALLIKDGFLNRISDQIDEKIKSLKQEKEQLKKRKEFIEAVLHNYADGEGIVEIKDEDDKVQYYMSPKVNVTRSVNMSDVNEIEATYTLPKMDYSDYQTIILLLHEHGFGTLAKKLEKETTLSCGVTQLPENHKAIIKHIRPTVSITKTKPKG